MSTNADTLRPPFLRLPAELHAMIAPLVSIPTLHSLTYTSRALTQHYLPELEARGATILGMHLDDIRAYSNVHSGHKPIPPLRYRYYFPARIREATWCDCSFPRHCGISQRQVSALIDGGAFSADEDDAQLQGALKEAWTTETENWIMRNGEDLEGDASHWHGDDYPQNDPYREEELWQYTFPADNGQGLWCGFLRVQKWVDKILLRSGSIEGLRSMCLACGAWDGLHQLQALVMRFIMACGRGTRGKQDVSVLNMLIERILELEGFRVANSKSETSDFRFSWEYAGKLLVRKARVDLMLLLWERGDNLFQGLFSVYTQCEENLLYVLPILVEEDSELSEPDLLGSLRDRINMTRFLFEKRTMASRRLFEQDENAALDLNYRRKSDFQAYCFGVAFSAKRKDHLGELKELSRQILEFLISNGLDVATQSLGKVFEVGHWERYSREFGFLKKSGPFLLEILTEFGWRWDGTKGEEVEFVFRLCELHERETHTEAFQYLVLQHGVPVDIPGLNGHTPLMAIVAPLVIQFCTYKSAIDLANHYANHVKGIEFLIKNGANPMATDTSWKLSPIAVVATWGYPELMHYLVDADVRRAERYGDLSTAEVIDKWFKDDDFWLQHLPEPHLSRQEMKEKVVLRTKVFWGTYEFLTQEEHERRLLEESLSAW